MTNYRLITYQDASGPRAGIALGDSFVDAAAATGQPQYASMLSILDDWRNAEKKLATAAATMADPRPLDGVKLLPPVHYPLTIYCAGANYSDHVARMLAKQGLPMDPDPHELGLKPWHFIKPSRTAVGDNAVVGTKSAQLDWEAELAVVIGHRARNVSIDEALGHVAGYMIANDISARDLTRRPGISDVSPFKYDWVGQKCFDGCCPLGPALVPAAQVADPQSLGIRLWVNEQLRQDSNSGRMIFSIAEQIAHLSSRLTLHPGDVILTGTPMGVGAETGEWLAKGDVIRVEIDGLGRLTTTIGSIEGFL
jgi:2-keto-4-pentenoate hydratase/2-oxohepta-3-ene-1,7-dioic acid hydratase in catechol pathway